MILSQITVIYLRVKPDMAWEKAAPTSFIFFLAPNFYAEGWRRNVNMCRVLRKENLHLLPWESGPWPFKPGYQTYFNSHISDTATAKMADVQNMKLSHMRNPVQCWWQQWGGTLRELISKVSFDQSVHWELTSLDTFWYNIPIYLVWKKIILMQLNVWKDRWHLAGGLEDKEQDLFQIPWKTLYAKAV